MADLKLPALPEPEVIERHTLGYAIRGYSRETLATIQREAALWVLEEAAKACEAQRPKNERSDWTDFAFTRAEAMDDCADAIRALKESL